MPADDSRTLRTVPDAPDNDELLRLVLESATDYAIFSLNPEGLVTSWNNGAERVLGYRSSEIVGKSADIIFIPEEREKGAPEVERALAITEGRAEDERWQMRANGTRFWASGLMLPLSNPELGFVKILRDRTEAHLADAQLRENEERFRILATNIPQLVFRCRSDGSRLWGSPQWIEFTGLSLEESLGFGWLDAIHPDDRDRTLSAWKEAQQQNEYYLEHRVRRDTDGEWRWHQTRARPVATQRSDIAEPGAEDWVGTMTDVHDMRRLQDQQIVLLQELQHRTRNLLAVIQSIAGQTLRKARSLPEFEQEFGGRLRAMSRVQALTARHHLPTISLRELVEMELAAHGDGVTAEGRVTLNGSETRLPAEQLLVLGLALHELATNAVKHGALGQAGARLSINWAPQAIDDKTLLVLEWRESGVRLAQASEDQRRKGYGSELIERALPYQLGAQTELRFSSDGVICRIAIPFEQDEKVGR